MSKNDRRRKNHMIAHDDIVITFHYGNAIFNIKVATRNGRKSAPEMIELVRAVVRDDVTVSYSIERSRFAPEIYRPRENVLNILQSEEDQKPQPAAASNPRRGRPKKKWANKTAA
jgi:hypothetical protein